MFCANCGAPVPEGHKYCEKCGAPINQGAVNVETPGNETGTSYNTTGAGFDAVNAPVYTAADTQKKTKWPVVAAICLGAALFVGAGIFTVVKVRSFIRNNITTSVPNMNDPDLEEFFDDDEFSFDYSGGFSYDSDNGFSFYHDGDSPFEKDDEEASDEFDVDGYINDHLDGYNFTPEATHDYSYAKALSYGDYMYLEGKGAIKDSTVIYGDKTIGEFCDYVDSNVLESGRKIDRKLLYSLLAIHLVDESYYQGAANKEYFEQSMMYCLMFANEFHDMNMELDSCMYYTSEPTTYYYELEIGEKDDTWTVDYSKEQIFMNYGTIDYKSAGDDSMFSKKTKLIWMSAIDQFFGIK